MFQSKQNTHTICNNNLPILGTIFFCWIFYLAYVIDWWFLLLLVIVPFLFYKKKINIKQIVVVSIVVIIYVLLTIFANDFSLISLINKRPQVIRKAIINFFNQQYDEETSSFIKLILLNIKDGKTWIFYKQVVDLGIVWLFCISGFHISLISWIIKWIFKKKQKLGWYLNLTIISFYSYLLNFSYGSLRIIFKNLLSPLFTKFQIKQAEKLGYVGLFISITNPSCFINFGFVLSMLISSVRFSVYSMNLNNKIINSIISNFLAFIIMIPFAFLMNNKISLLTFFNSFIFSYLSIFVFFYFLLFAWLPFMAIVHKAIIIGTYTLVGNISFRNIFIYSSPWPAWALAIYFCSFHILLRIVYLIVIDNKI